MRPEPFSSSSHSQPSWSHVYREGDAAVVYRRPTVNSPVQFRILARNDRVKINSNLSYSCDIARLRGRLRRARSRRRGLFCTLPDGLQVAGIRELGRVVQPGGIIRCLEYTRPSGGFRRAMTRLWEPWVYWAYGAGFDRVEGAAFFPHLRQRAKGCLPTYAGRSAGEMLLNRLQRRGVDRCEGPKPKTPDGLQTYLHEVAHVVCGHRAENKLTKPRHVEKLESELWSFRVMREENIPITCGMVDRRSGMSGIVWRKIEQPDTASIRLQPNL